MAGSNRLPWTRGRRDRFCSVRSELDRRFQATLAAALGPAHLPPGWPPLRMPPAVRETLLGLALLDGTECPGSFVAHFAETMPRLLVAQWIGPTEVAHTLFSRRLDMGALPRFREALLGLFAALQRAGIPPVDLLGVPSPAGLLQVRPTLAALYGPTLFGSGLPFLGASPAELDLLGKELLAGQDPDTLIDRRLSANLVHELSRDSASLS